MIELLLFFSIVMLLLSIQLKDFPLTSFAAITFILNGLYIMNEGIVGMKIWYTWALGMILLGVGLYLLIRSPYETFKKAKINTGDWWRDWKRTIKTRK